MLEFVLSYLNGMWTDVLCKWLSTCIGSRVKDERSRVL